MPITEDRKTSASLTAAWDGASPTTEPTGTCITLDCAGCETAAFHLAGTFTATITWEVSLTGATGQWVTVKATLVSAGTKATTTAGAGATNVIVAIPVSGYRLVRGRCSAFTSGPVPIWGRASTAGMGDNANYT